MKPTEPRPRPGADDVLGNLLAAIDEAVALVRQVVAGAPAEDGTVAPIDLGGLGAVGTAMAARVDAAEFLIGHTAPLIGELRALRAAGTADHPTLPIQGMPVEGVD
jgi:hypothetical protein